MFTTLIARVLGVLLLIAAGLKVYGLGVEPIARMGVFSTPAIQFLVIAFEVGLGVWLLSGRQPIAAWLTVLLTFSAFAAVSFYQGWIGQASCGCLGNRVTVSPWFMFGVDTAIVGIVLKFRPDLTPLRHSPRDFLVRPTLVAAALLGGYLLLFGSVSAFAHYRYGSLDAFLANLRNERLSISPGILDMGHGVPGETREASLELTNYTAEPIRVIGGTADCSCTVLGDLPLTIQPGETRAMKIQLRLPHARGMFNRKAELSIDDQGFRRVGFRLTGRIDKAPDVEK